MGEAEVLDQRIRACEARIKQLEEKLERNSEITTELRTEMRAIKDDISEIKTDLKEKLDELNKKLPDTNQQIKFYQKLILVFVSILATTLGAVIGYKVLMKLPL